MSRPTRERRTPSFCYCPESHLHLQRVDEGLGDTLKVEVRFGTQHKQLTLVSSFDPDSGQGTKGVYNAYFIPTAPGDYTFHFFGAIGKQKVDITVKSSPTTFESAHGPAAIEFPQTALSRLQR